MDKKQLIKRFTQEGYTLRPESLNHLTQYFAELKIQNNNSISTDVVNNHMNKILDNVRVLQTHQGDIILGEQTVKGAIELLQRPSNQNMEMEVDTNQLESEDSTIIDEAKDKKVNDIINEKYLHTIVVLDTMKETPRIQVHNSKPYTEFIVNATTTEEKKRVVSLGTAQDKINCFQRRFDIIKMRLQKGKKYDFGLDDGKKKKDQQLVDESDEFKTIKINDIGSLIGSDQKEMNVLGMIYEGLVGEYFIQDELSRVKLSLANTKVEQGYVTVSSIVIAQGFYDQMNGVFAVSKLIIPEFDDEPSSSFASSYNKDSEDLFGAKAKVGRILGKLIQLEIESAAQGKSGPRQQNLTRFQRERQLELGIFDLELNPYFKIAQKNEYCICIFSDFSLSDRSILKRFESILAVYEKQLKPLVIVLMGAFFNVSEISSEAVNDQVREAVSDFLQLLNKFRSLRDNCYWLMVPHINDIGGAPFQPKSELPEDLFAEVKAQVPFFKLVQNPCRISVFGKTFLLQRNDLLRELRKKQIVINPHKDIQLNYVQTILSQRHLSPLPLITKPALWNYDNALQFYENPDYLILADSYSDQFDFVIEEKILTSEEHAQQITHKKSHIKKTYVINPGNFEKKSTFTVIYPLTGEIQNCSV